MQIDQLGAIAAVQAKLMDWNRIISWIRIVKLESFYQTIFTEVFAKGTSTIPSAGKSNKQNRQNPCHEEK